MYCAMVRWALKPWQVSSYGHGRKVGVVCMGHIEQLDGFIVVAWVCCSRLAFPGIGNVVCAMVAIVVAPLPRPQSFKASWPLAWVDAEFLVRCIVMYAWALRAHRLADPCP